MKRFDYISPATAAEACQILAEYGSDAAILAGGTDLLIEARRPSMDSKVIVDISSIAELHGICESDGAIIVGPLTTHTTLLRSGLVRNHAPFLAVAAAAIGSPQVRNRGTIGGNIMNAAACADTLPPLIALGATVTLQSLSGSSELELAKLIVKAYQTAASPDQLLTSIRFPKLPAGTGSAFIKLGRRNALSISRLSVAALLRFDDDGRIAEASIVPGAAFPTWKRINEAEQMLIGEKATTKLFAAAGEKVSEQMIKETGRRWSTEYKEPVLAVLVRRALEQCASSSLAPSEGERAGHRGPSLANFPSLSHSAGERGPSPANLSSLSPSEGERAGERGPSLRGHQPANPSSQCIITTLINGRSLTLTTQANGTLLELLRDQLGLTGTKCGCEIGECGACTVLLDGRSVNSCLVLAPQIHGREVTTIEGLAPPGKLHPLQESFMDHDAVHCGFCTPGMLMSAKALFDWNPRPTATDIRTAISGNLCRCTGYQQIVEAIAAAPESARTGAKTAKP